MSGLSIPESLWKHEELLSPSDGPKQVSAWAKWQGQNCQHHCSYIASTLTPPPKFLLSEGAWLQSSLQAIKTMIFKLMIHLKLSGI